jgi:hypothetical protein
MAASMNEIVAALDVKAHLSEDLTHVQKVFDEFVCTRAFRSIASNLLHTSTSARRDVDT